MYAYVRMCTYLRICIVLNVCVYVCMHGTTYVCDLTTLWMGQNSYDKGYCNGEII